MSSSIAFISSAPSFFSVAPRKKDPARAAEQDAGLTLVPGGDRLLLPAQKAFDVVLVADQQQKHDRRNEEQNLSIMTCPSWVAPHGMA